MGDIAVPSDILEIITILCNNGFEAYVVGGAVRDMCLNKIPHDWDVCTSATPEEVKSCFTNNRIIETGIKHGTVTVLLNGNQYEVTTFRVDGEYSDGRHPDTVYFTQDIISDLTRRDFTINAMAWSPVGGVIDPFKGLDDLAAELIRCVGNPDDRFMEDGLRILRAVRFASTLGFSIEENTSASVIKNRELLQGVSYERIASELNKILMGDGVKSALITYWQVLAVPIPEITAAIGFDQKNPYHNYSLWGHTVQAIAMSELNLTVRLSMLLHDLSKPKCMTVDECGVGHFYGHAKLSAEISEEILHRLKYDNETIRRVTRLIGFHDNHILSTHSAIRRWLNRLGEGDFRLLLSVERADALAHKNPTERISEINNAEIALEEVLAEKPCFTVKDLKIDGYHIISLGVPEGKNVGFILKSLLDMVISDEIENERDILLEQASKIYKQTNI